MPASAANPESAQEAVNEVLIEDIGPATKQLTITIPPEAVTQKLQDSLGTLGSETALPGFRRGKVPRRLLEKRFGTAVRSETTTQLIADAYAKALEDHGIEPVGEPEKVDPDAEPKIEDGKPLTFAVKVEVVPDFQLPPLDGIEIKKPLFEITDDLIHDELDRQLLQLGTAKRIDGGFQAGDRLVGHVAVTKGGETEPLFQEDNAVIICPGTDDGGRGPVLGLMIDGLAPLLGSKRVGDAVTMETTGPEAYERDDLRGAKLTINFQINFAERIEPATVPQMIERFGLGSEENVREQIRLAIQHRHDQDQAAAMREQICNYLLDAVEFELPKKLSAAQAARTLEGHRIELLHRGLTPDEVESQLAEVRADSDAQTRNRLKLFFLLRRLAEHFKVEVSPQEVNGRIAAMAALRGFRPEQLRAELARTGRLGEVERMIRDHKATDLVVARATVTEIPAAEWKAKTGKSATDAPQSKAVKEIKKKTKKKKNVAKTTKAPKTTRAAAVAKKKTRAKE